MKFFAVKKHVLKRILIIGLPFLAFIAAIVFVNPIGEFPLFDDWSFSRTVLNYHETGKLKICGWASMTLVMQTWWGILWTKLFGFSFTVLRCSTIFCAFATMALFYKILSTQHKDFKIISVFCLILVFNPIFFLCSLSFMTDIPFVFLMMLSCSYFYSFLSTEKTSEYLAAILFCLSAMLIRQLAVIIPFAFLVTWLFKKGFTFKNMLVALIPLLTTLVALKMYNNWYFVTQDPGNLYGAREMELLIEIRSNLTAFIARILVSSFTYLFYAGLFLFPSIMAFIFKSSNNKLYIRTFSLIALLLCIIVLTINFFINNKYPFENVISILGSNGPGLFMIFDSESYLQNQNLNYKWILRFFIIIGAMGTSGLFILLYDYVKQSLGSAKRSEMTFLMLLLIGNTILISTSIRFDRYLLTLLPLLLFVIYKCLSSDNSLSNKNIALKTVILTIPIFIYTVAGTNHFFAWNKARWKGLNWLINKQEISPEKIDGGFEFNGWYCFDPGYKESKGKNWYWVKDNFYVIAFNQQSGYAVEKTLPYFNVLQLRNDSLFVLRKAQPAGEEE